MLIYFFCEAVSVPYHTERLRAAATSAMLCTDSAQAATNKHTVRLMVNGVTVAYGRPEY